MSHLGTGTTAFTKGKPKGPGKKEKSRCGKVGSLDLGVRYQEAVAAAPALGLGEKKFSEELSPRKREKILE